MKAMEGARRRGEVGSPPWPYLGSHHIQEVELPS